MFKESNTSHQKKQYTVEALFRPLDSVIKRWENYSTQAIIALYFNLFDFTLVSPLYGIYYYYSQSSYYSLKTTQKKRKEKRKKQ